jgi:hypothetical protein
MTSTPISAGDRLRGVLARSDRVSEQPRRPKEALLLAFFLLIQPPPSPDLSLIMKFTSIAALAALAATVQAQNATDFPTQLVSLSLTLALVLPSNRLTSPPSFLLIAGCPARCWFDHPRRHHHDPVQHHPGCSSDRWPPQRQPHRTHTHPFSRRARLVLTTSSSLKSSQILAPTNGAFQGVPADVAANVSFSADPLSGIRSRS